MDSQQYNTVRQEAAHLPLATMVSVIVSPALARVVSAPLSDAIVTDGSVGGSADGGELSVLHLIVRAVQQTKDYACFGSMPLEILLPIAAFFALMPPFVRIFAHDGRIFGAPAILVFLLTLWLGLILVVRALSRRLLNSDQDL